MDRTERIRFLLTHLEDVRAGLRDSNGAEGVHVPLMCRAWNSASYQELERLLPQLRAAHPRLSSHLHHQYLAPRRRVKACPRCEGVIEVWHSANFHTHGRKSVALTPKVVRVVPPGVRPEFVALAVAWLASHWQDEVYVPAELLPLVGEETNRPPAHTEGRLKSAGSRWGTATPAWA